MLIPNNVLAFANGDASVYKMFADYYNHFRAQNGAQNVEYQKTTTDGEGKTVELTFADKEEKMNSAMKREILRVAGIQNMGEFPLATWASHPTLKWATFAVVNAMVDMVMPDSLIESIGLFSEIRNIGFGDSAAFDVKPRDLFVVSKAGRANRLSEVRKQFEGQVTVIPENHEISVTVSLYKVLAGKESLAEFVMKAVKSIEVQITYDAYSAFSTAMANVSNTASTGLRVAGYSQAEFVRIAQTVSAWNGGQKAIAIGTQAALANILPADANYRYDIQSEFVKIGYVRNFQNTDVMVLPQVADWNTPFALKLSDSYIWFLSPSSQKLVKVVLEGSTLAYSDDSFKNANLTQNSVMQKSWGTAVATNAVAGTIEL